VLPRDLLVQPAARHVTLKREEGQELGITLRTHQNQHGSRILEIRKGGLVHKQHGDAVSKEDVVVGIDGEPMLHAEHDCVKYRITEGSSSAGGVRVSFMSPKDIASLGVSLVKDKKTATPIKHVVATPKRGQPLGLRVRTEPDAELPGVNVHTVNAVLPGSAAYEHHEIDEQVFFACSVHRILY